LLLPIEAMRPLAAGKHDDQGDDDKRSHASQIHSLLAAG
jgi:hypothetical protein